MDLHRMHQDIIKMPEEARARFKALWTLMNEVKDIDAEKVEALKQLELKFYEMYKGVYAERAQLVNGETEACPKHLEQYTYRVGKLKDEKYNELLVTPCDVKNVQAAKGVSDFWHRVLTTDSKTTMEITDKDKPILGYCIDI